MAAAASAAGLLLLDMLSVAAMRSWVPACCLKQQRWSHDWQVCRCCRLLQCKAMRYCIALASPALLACDDQHELAVCKTLAFLENVLESPPPNNPIRRDFTLKATLSLPFQRQESISFCQKNAESPSWARHTRALRRRIALSARTTQLLEMGATASKVDAPARDARRGPGPRCRRRLRDAVRRRRRQNARSGHRRRLPRARVRRRPRRGVRGMWPHETPAVTAQAEAQESDGAGSAAAAAAAAHLSAARSPDAAREPQGEGAGAAARVRVTCPADGHAGKPITVQIPDGRKARASIPDGCAPGETFTILVPALAAPPVHRVSVTCPPDKAPGSQFLVKVPSGQTIRATVPQRLGPAGRSRSSRRRRPSRRSTRCCRRRAVSLSSSASLDSAAASGTSAAASGTAGIAKKFAKEVAKDYAWDQAKVAARRSWRPSCRATPWPTRADFAC